MKKLHKPSSSTLITWAKVWIIASLIVIASGIVIAHITASKSAIQTSYAPIDKAMRQLGAKSVCRYDSDGDTFTAAKPYHYEYYTMTDGQNLTISIEQAIEKLSYSNFTIDYPTITQLQDDIAQDQSSGMTGKPETSEGDTFSSTTDYLSSKSDGYTLSVAIHRDDTTSLNCTDGADYGQTKTVSGKDILIGVFLEA